MPTTCTRIFSLDAGGLVEVARGSPCHGPLVVSRHAVGSREPARLHSYGEQASLALCRSQRPAPDISASTPLFAGSPGDAWPRTARSPRWRDCRARPGSWGMRFTPCPPIPACPGIESSTRRAGSASVAASQEESFPNASGWRRRGSNSIRADASAWTASAGSGDGPRIRNASIPGGTLSTPWAEAAPSVSCNRGTSPQTPGSETPPPRPSAAGTSRSERAGEARRARSGTRRRIPDP